MFNKMYINPVSVSHEKSTYPVPSFITRELLENELRRKGLDIELGELVKGGSVSQIYAALLNRKPVIVKHTENLIPFDPTELFIGKNGHNTDSSVLKLLHHFPKVRVPQIITYFPEITTTVMEDLRISGYQLMEEQILDHRLDLQSSVSVCKMLANLNIGVRKWKPFATNESAEESIYERGLELRLAYPNSQLQYLELEREYLRYHKYWLWPDGHPKNIFLNPDGDAAFIDFGRSHWADQRYLLPNFLSHIALYGISGYIKPDAVIKYIRSGVIAYQKIDPVNEGIFCKYFAMELLHRSNGKWIRGIDTASQKTAIAMFGLKIFDEKISSLDDLLDLYSNVCDKIS